MKNPKVKKTIPFDFVLEQLADLDPFVRPMFGCYGVYVRDSIVLVLRERNDFPEDNGVWLATTHEHHKSLKKDFPKMRSITVFGSEPTGWQVLPLDSLDFEESVIRACEFIIKKDPRIGKTPKSLAKK